MNDPGWTSGKKCCSTEKKSVKYCREHALRDGDRHSPPLILCDHFLLPVSARLFLKIDAGEILPAVIWLFQSGESRLRGAAFLGIFFAIDRRNMRWVLIEIWSPNPKFFFVRVDPLPQNVTPRASLSTRIALHAHEIGRKPMAIATAAAPAMV